MNIAVPGLLLLGAAAVLAVVSWLSRRLERLVMSTSISTVAELVTLHAAVTSQTHGEHFAQRVALQGVLHCDEPLISDLTHLPCAAFRYRVERQWEGIYEDRDSQGQRLLRTRQGSDQVASNERRVPFRLQDATGSVLVLSDGATLEMEQVAERFEHLEGRTQITRRHAPYRGGRRTLGYRFYEEALPLERAIYVLGQAVDRGGQPVICAQPASHELFLVSLRTREQILHTARRTVALARTAAYACAPLGVLLLVLALLLRR